MILILDGCQHIVVTLFEDYEHIADSYLIMGGVETPINPEMVEIRGMSNNCEYDPEYIEVFNN